jgi:hypothetical protein
MHSLGLYSMVLRKIRAAAFSPAKYHTQESHIGEAELAREPGWFNAMFPSTEHQPALGHHKTKDSCALGLFQSNPA